MGAPDTIKRLVDSFKRNEEYYINGSINETQLRREFLDPFFAALGWDVENKAGYADAYKDVIHEYSLKTKDVREAPDYCFRIGGTRKFFVEAKKPSVNVKDDIHPAFQLRSYAWSAKLPLSVLTDFEEFAVYDCRIPPNKKDKASNARIMFITYDQYIEKWDEIEDIFSREAILKGSFDKYIESNKKKKGTAEVDLVFLEQMETWRKSLAKNIALRNPSLSIRELNYSVQKTIDRIIFLRICEDRGIEDYGQLMALQNGTSVYERLKQIFYRADEKYNSGLFHFENERDRTEPPDNLTLDLTIDDKTIKEIVKELYYPESPYEFSVLPADILGQVYEQFLGKVIRLTAGHQAVIEDKPEVKKAGGVYYTPTYIVDYIVNNTIGKLLNVIPGEAKESVTQDGILNSHAELVSASQLINKIPKQVRDDRFQTPKEVSTLKILDPACGSGSFLLGAYQYLLDWHLKFYLTELETSNKLLQQKHPPVYINDKGDYLLTTSEKKRILLNNIYGVDIDPQAVEVTKLSLMLKVLEGESTQTLNNELQFFRERALPDLSNNIKCGNSLIGPDFYNQTEMNFIDDEEKLRINVFDWHKEFPGVFISSPLGRVEGASIGFDVVIGNPPYMRIQTLYEYQPNSVNYLKEKYHSAASGNIDIYITFLEKALSLINNFGVTAYILPHKFFQAEMGKQVREIIKDKNAVERIISFGANQIFKDATTYTCLFFMSKKSKTVFDYYLYQLGDQIKESINDLSFNRIDIKELGTSVWNFHSGLKDTILQKLYSMPTKLENIAKKVFVGLQTSADKIYVLKILSQLDKNHIKVYSKSLDKELIIERGLVKPFLMGKDIKKYEKPLPNNVVIFPYVVVDHKAELMPKEYIINNFPIGWKYLEENKNELENRENGKMKGDRFYAYIYPKNLGEFERKKIMTPEISLGCQMTFDFDGAFYHTTKIYSLIFNKNLKEDWNYLIGILNSKLLWFFIQSTGYTLKGGYFTFKTKYLNPFPIRLINFITPNDVVMYNKIIENVKLILKLKQDIIKSKTPTERTAIERQIQATDTQIDQLVYQLYGLTEEEIKIVEGV